MPFTFSHPVAVLPLLRGLRGRGPLVASALVAGSMAPDLPFFAASWQPELYRGGTLTHRWWAVPTVDVALAAVLVGGWHLALRRPLLGLLPPRWAAPAEAVTARRRTGWGTGRASGRATGYPAGRRAGYRAGHVTGPAGVAAFALSAAIGAASHVGWDEFTHPGRAGGRLLPVLERRVGAVPLCVVAQYGGSAVALVGLLRYLDRELREVRELPAPDDAPAPAPPILPQPVRRAAVLLAAGLGAAHRVARARRLRRADGGGGHPSLIADLCFGGGAGVVTGAALLALADRLGNRRYLPQTFG
ncbi:DUF4184 family protein [Kitasatospora azatica]|uniref:DUF4184 family protein n=1 Tax=Kitasatospora azatica TaxID=58347 RepID=UPI0007C68416|nr:DUF4184 family protein [Kitasatospora azatica]